MTIEIDIDGRRTPLEPSKLKLISQLQAEGTNSSLPRRGVWGVLDSPSIVLKIFGEPLDSAKAQHIRTLVTHGLGKLVAHGHPLFAAPIGHVYEDGRLTGYVMPRAVGRHWDKLAGSSDRVEKHLQRARLYACQFLYLRNLRILHGDISTGNLIFDDPAEEQGRVCIIDFDEAVGRGLQRGGGAAKGFSLCPPLFGQQRAELRENATALCTICLIALGYDGTLVPWDEAAERLPWSEQVLAHFNARIIEARQRDKLVTWISTTMSSLVVGKPISWMEAQKAAALLGNTLKELGESPSPAEAELTSVAGVTTIRVSQEDIRGAARRARIARNESERARKDAEKQLEVVKKDNALVERARKDAEKQLEVVKKDNALVAEKLKAATARASSWLGLIAIGVGGVVLGVAGSAITQHGHDHAATVHAASSVLEGSGNAGAPVGQRDPPADAGAIDRASVVVDGGRAASMRPLPPPTDGGLVDVHKHLQTHPLPRGPTDSLDKGFKRWHMPPPVDVGAKAPALMLFGWPPGRWFTQRVRGQFAGQGWAPATFEFAKSRVGVGWSWRVTFHAGGKPLSCEVVFGNSGNPVSMSCDLDLDDMYPRAVEFSCNMSVENKRVSWCCTSSQNVSYRMDTGQYGDGKIELCADASLSDIP